MYNVTISNRLKKLNERLYNVDYQTARPWYFEDINILNIPGNEWLRKKPIVIRKAYAIKYVAEHMPIVVFEDELIVGYNNQNSVEFGISIPEYLSRGEKEFLSDYGISEYSIYAHHAPDWEKIVKIGIVGLRDEVYRELKKKELEDNENVEAQDYLNSMLISLEALEIFANRYKDEILLKAKSEKNDVRKKELQDIACCLTNVPLKPAETLHEALQAYWITYTLLNSCGEMIPLGRIDQYFISFYTRDVKKGYIDRAIAIDLIGSFLIKCNEKNVQDCTLLEDHRKVGYLVSGINIFPKEERLNLERNNRNHKWNVYNSADDNGNRFFGQEANNRMMTAVVGGLLSNGEDATNELSYIIVQLMRELKLLTPTLGARIHKNTPEAFIRTLAETLQYGQGEPIIYNDEAILKGYANLDIPLEEGRGYSSDGCWETILPGKTNFTYILINVLQAMEYALNNGKKVKTGKTEGVKTGELNSFLDFQSFYDAVIHQISCLIDAETRWTVNTLGTTALVAPDPLFSVMSDDCIQKGKDFYEIGARYQMKMLLLTGFADTVDSLMVIKKIVYDEKIVSLEELHRALKQNWDGYERLHAYVINRIDKYGNDKDEVDKLGARLVEDFCKKIKDIRNQYQHIIWTGGIGTFHIYGILGEGIGATPNGRFAFEPLAPNYSPVPGCEKNGPLAIIKSSCKADLRDMMSGTPIDISINANEFKGESGILRLMDMIKGFCELDGQIMSITSMKIDDLKDAKVHPEKHKSLRVRMGGLSAYFVQLAPAAQDSIIKRFGNG